MIESRLSLLGLYNWDNTIFDQLQVPTNVDKNIFVDNLLMEVAELEIIYTDFNFLKSAIGVWSKKMVYNWTLLDTALRENYDPLHNYDRTETKSEDESGTNTSATTDTIGITENGTNTASSSSSGTNGGDVEVPGFNSTDLVVQTITNNTNRGSASTEASNTITRNTTDTTNLNASNSVLRNYTIRAYGNIGVTTSQQMLEAEINLRQNFNIYDLMIMDFKDRFCLLVY